ncbi:hypothetical protein SNOG_15996 [Parastagonospora nodorum SN15]|uniref:Uncharacterized protein n=1 Tax=Phaeosphaeria nodorum (strain SN15 / ATCC MYA-4574 / FGSC 10173) TaxID=321614 RepID=Q0TWR6_PHANO|nr:hypothetical protein SNOG_15996 [Parastagonospora nodorum SN15]EAT76575.1 hypothetical protein SNOG_15996 [Parastagonospora nodorum SN15]
MSSSFLLLPREVRDIIYDYYVCCDGGYVYDFEGNKLVQANGNHIELALLRTCHQVAREMNGLALPTNTITFSTFFSEKTRGSAGQFHAAISRQKQGKDMFIEFLGYKLYTPQMATVATARYPMFEPYITSLASQSGPFFRPRNGNPYGQPPSLWREFAEFAAGADIRIRRGQNISCFARKDYEFGLAFPEEHARGLIPFCVENAKLRVERYVSLWQNALPVARQLDYTGVDLGWLRWVTDRSDSDMHLSDPEWLRNDKLAARDITKSIGTWIVEAHRLPSLGMPEGSYTLVFDGGPMPEKSTAAFAVVQRDAVWQAAFTTRFPRGSTPEHPWLNMCAQPGYFFESLPDAIRHITTTSSLIRCNFDPGQLHIDSAKALADARVGWSLERWQDDWDTHEPREFETESPLPPWYKLRWQRVMPVL